jgi:CelD/BcsL family acetyltransferase involved in cellulose biosynthesis
MNIHSRDARELTTRHWDLWTRYQESNHELVSPFFRAEFTRAVADVRDDVHVGLIEREGETIGFFPFQRQGRRAKPVGGRLSDYQAVIGPSDLTVCPKRLLQGCGLAVWDFDHLLVSQRAFAAYHRLVDRSPVIDLTQGFDAYRASLEKAGADELKQTLRKARKLARELGPLQLQWMNDDPDQLKRLMSWKSSQYRETRITDVFSFPWTRRLLHQLLGHRAMEFAGVLSVLYAGDVPVAMHMGMRSNGVLHWWFPAYDPQFGQYSPGRILLMQLAQHGPTEQIHQIDLGRGVAPYKKRVMTGATLVAQGSIDLRPLSRAVRESWLQTRQWVRNSPLAIPARMPARMLYRLREWIDFR